MKIAKFILGLALIFFSCNRDDNEYKEIIITSEEMQAGANIDYASDDVLDIVESEFLVTLEDGEFGGLSSSTSQFYPLCAKVTRVPDYGTYPTEGQLITKTIDFGRDYFCHLNGNVIQGKIIITFNFNPSATIHTINYQLVDFNHNYIKFNGTKTLTRIMSASVDGHPIVTLNMDLNATFPNGNVYTRVGTRVREFIEGASTPSYLGDNVYKITGSWTTTFPNTTVQTSVITTPLFVEMKCENVLQPLLPSLGVITITRNDNVATLDYGDGTCDNLAFFTFNGVSRPIVFEEY